MKNQYKTNKLLKSYPQFLLDFLLKVYYNGYIRR